MELKGAMGKVLDFFRNRNTRTAEELSTMDDSELQTFFENKKTQLEQKFQNSLRSLNESYQALEEKK